MAIPVLIISDAVSAPSGLGRVTAMIAKEADERLKDVCRIATLGYGGPGSQKFKFFQYHIEGMGNDWIIPNLPEVWDDWAGSEPGIIFCIWDAHRLGWFSRPSNPEFALPSNLKTFFGSTRIERWIYAPVDAEGLNDKLAYPIVQSLLGFDRVLAYGKWGEGVIRRSLGEEEANARSLSSIPHGIDSSVFFPRARAMSRELLFPAIKEDKLLIGAVAANQKRKDWALWAGACSMFLSRHPNTYFWAHSDKPEKDWSFPALLVDSGLRDRTAVTFGHISDDLMASAYSACDLTLGIGAGEGWGFPLAESLACGTPVIHGNYAGGVEVIDNPDLLVTPIAYRYEGEYCCKRPVYNAKDWTDKMEQWLGKRADLNPKFYWENNWPLWEHWFRQPNNEKGT